MDTHSYAAVFEPTDRPGGYVVTFPDVPEAVTEGNDLEEATVMAADALGLALLTYLELDRPLPEPQARGVMIAPEPAKALKVALISTFRQSGLSRTELARRLGKDEKEARRLLDPFTNTKLPLIAEAMLVMGKRVIIGIEEIA